MSSEEILNRAAAKARSEREARRAQAAVPLRSLAVWGCGAGALALWVWAAVLVFVPLVQAGEGTWIWCAGSEESVEEAEEAGVPDPEAVCSEERAQDRVDAVGPLTAALPPAAGFVLLARGRR
ncbi:hypothetical protein [Nocardiopsis baichengensis]|uniref:hypothetical protein n=1 Tax=Nocardiopsis baichengensis TaxID=280240 RepID=UPI0003499CDC|nr:hypothetical protein [Nocardiopsis baichengensis]